MFYDMPYVHMLDYIANEAPQLNIDQKQASYLVSIIGERCFPGEQLIFFLLAGAQRLL